MKKLKLKLIAITVATMTTATLPSVSASAAWKQNEGDWNYLSDSGELKTGWVNDNGAWYYLDNSGTMKTGWINDNGAWYYANNSGAMKTGWVNDSGAWYYLNNSGAMKTGWINDNGAWYFADTSGTMQTGVVQVDGKTYSLDAATGAMQVGNVTINGKAYTFAQSGEAVGDNIPPSKVFNSAGVQLTGTNTSAKDTNASDASNTSVADTSSNSSSSSSSSHHSSNQDINAGVSTSHLEDYREQYHYSVPGGWANDPNGMVYFNGEWHLFYQYYPDGVAWGPMHWAQAVSTDLVHWKDLGVAIEPGDDKPGDGKKYIFSGSAVADINNTSGFFDGIEGGGLVAAYTENNDNAGTQQQSIAYSKDNGRTWIKYNDGKPVLTNDMDSLKNRDFRDPKIFWSEDANEWMMVVAGGPLRFFSSTDLKTWKAEAMQPEITTECPDLYKLQVGDTGTYKWVLSEGGRYYRVGDFKKVGDVWKFVPDNNDHLTMNFAPDAYAAQTYYGTGENGTPDGRRIMIQWMNNWSYAGSIGKITQTFNGQFTLQNEMKLVQTDKGIRLTQEPIKEYESLRQAPTTFNNVTISPDKPNIMSNLSGSQYEIVSEFTPDANTTEVGFKLRVDKDVNQETVVKYNTATGEVTIDRSKSGKAPSSSFKDPSIGKVTKTADGKIQLHIFVDESSVEVYANDGEITGTNQIFPNRSSQGIEVYSVGGNTQATIQYYPLSGIWNNNIKGTNSVELSLSESNFTKEVGEQFSIYTTTLPSTAAQGVNWTISNPSVVKILSQDDTKTTFEVTGIGNTDLTATSKDGRSKKTASLGVYDRKITKDISDLTDFQSSTGNWYVNNGTYTSDALGIGDGFVTSAQMNNDLTATYTYSADAKFVSDGKPLTDGVASLVLFSQTRDASKGSLVANILWNGEYRVFNFPAGQNVASGKVDVDPNGIYHLKSEIKGNHMKYWINDKLVCDADQPYYDTPGYFGLNTCNAKVEYTNIRLTKTGVDTSTLGIVKTQYDKNLGDEFTIYTNQDVNYKFNDDASLKVIKVSDGTDSTKTKFKVIGIGKANITAMPTSGDAEPVTITVTSYETDPDGKGIIEGLSGFTTSGGGRWYVNGDAYVAEGGGDKFAISNTSIEAKEGANYTFETNATVLNPNDSCAPSLVLFSKSKDKPGDGALVFNVNPKEANWRIFEFNGSYGTSGSITPSADGKYDLKVNIVGDTVKYYINGTEVCSTPDFTKRSGYVGLMSWNANVEFRNTVFKAVDTTKTLGIATEYEKVKGDEFTIAANQDVNYVSSDPSIVDVKTGNSSKSTTFTVKGTGTATITATSVTNSGLKETITVNCLDTDPADLVDGLDNLKATVGKWYVKDGAYEVSDGGDAFAMSDTQIDVAANPDKTYTLETDANILSGNVASLVLLSQNNTDPKAGSIIANVNANANNYAMFAFAKHDITSGSLDDANKLADRKYHLKVELTGTHMKYLINDQVAYDGKQDCFTSGYLGLNVWNSNVAFTNINFTEGTTTGAAVTVTTDAAVTVTTGAAVQVTAPATGATPVSTIDAEQYTANIAWSETPAMFESKKVYTATITITPKAGYTITGVPEDFFTVDGADSTSYDAASGVITAVFPVTN